MALANGGPPTLQPIPSSLDFGDVAAGSQVTLVLNLKNNSGFDAVAVQSAVISNPAFTISPTAFPTFIQPQQVFPLQITFTAPATLGVVTATIDFNSDAANSPNSTPLRGNSVFAGTKALSISPSSWIFPDTKQLTVSAPVLFTVTNTGAAPAVVTVQIPSLDPNFVSTDLPASPQVLSAGQSFSFHVAFKPLGAGYIAVPNGITIVSDAPSSPNLIRLEGNGILIIPAYSVVGGTENGFIALGNIIQQFDTANFDVETDAYAERQLGPAGLGYESEVSRVQLQYDDIGPACVEIRDINEREETRAQLVPIGTNPNRKIRQQLADIKLTGELHTIRFTLVGGPLSIHAWSPRWVLAGETKKVSGLASCVPALEITTPCPLGPLQVGTFFSTAFMASGGTAPYTWSIVSGSLPPGLTLTTAGVLSGTPTLNGNFNYTIRVTDAALDFVQQQCALTVNAAPPPPVTMCTLVLVQTPPPSALQIGVPFSFQLQTTGGVPPFTFEVIEGQLPPGLSLNSATGLISGTPTTAGTYHPIFRVTDSFG